MDMKKVILLVGALLVAGVSAFAIRALISGGAGAPAAQAVAAALPGEQESGVHVLVAQTTLPIGTIISEEHVAFQPWPEDMVQNAYYLEEAQSSVPGVEDVPPARIEDVIGKVVRVSIGAGQPLSRESLVGPGESGFLAAALNPGMRAVTVPIDNISGVAGFVFPGDRVDLLLTHDIGGESGITDAETVSDTLKVAETIARNVRVLAIDQRTSDLEETPMSGNSVTFEVPPKMVEKIAVARMMGQLQLSLRSIKDQRQALEQAIADGSIQVGENQSTSEDLAMEFSVTQRPDQGPSTFTTGGEVSRFALDQAGRARGRQEARQQAGPPPPTVQVTRGRSAQRVVIGPAGNAAAPSGDSTGAAQQPVLAEGA
ncbi:Flp pilus assembly protein CpaB [Pacificimonas flava]|uniref:Flp pilus assembly protein RcpC/CpaB n=1 Tax=Pacificimonas flava TaxID=1234595 RepID=M2SCZ0_9SPHN|nr:Flp pilus assembly protein CpaB [Pacificimonas flava]EMD83230.1 Flp pilus assembly protein RcpC/CpaB [Pacificimonas flava]MBB5279206.1 pilus assembly protein CpaB [Pacificimonas flava]